MTEGRTLVVNACASVADPPASWAGPVAACGDAGFWAATDAVGVHSLPKVGIAVIAQGVLPPSLVMPPTWGGRSAAAYGLTLNLCVPSTTPAAYVVNAAPSLLHLAMLSAGRFATLVSSVVTDNTIAAAYDGNATVLFRQAGPQLKPPAEVTLYWSKDAPVHPPPLAQLLPAIHAQVRWTTSTTRAARLLTFNEAAGVAVGEAVSAASGFLNAFNASARWSHSMAITWPPPLPGSTSVSEMVSRTVLPFVSIITAACIVTGTIIGILTYVYSKHKTGGGANAARLYRNATRDYAALCVE